MFKLLTEFQLLMATDVIGGPPSTDYLSELLKDDEPEVIDLEEKKPDTKDKEEPGDKEDDKEDKEEIKKDEEDEDKDDEEDKEVEVDELEELEKELEEPSEDKLELVTPARRRDILKAFPDLFKKFPYLETAYYRDQKFTELFPTIKEAEQASETLQQYTALNQKLQTGDVEPIITSLAKGDKKAFGHMVDNFLPTLSKVNTDAYHHILGNLTKDIVISMVEEAKNSNDESLKTAAAVVHKFVFGNTKFVPKQPFAGADAAPINTEKDDELAKRERAFNERRFKVAESELSNKVDNSIKATIAQHIDPKQVMTEYIKDTAIDKALSKVGELMEKDTRFKSLLDKLWQNAANKDFAKTEMDKIKSACVSKARTLLPSVIKTARNEALKGMGKRVREEEPDTTTKKGNSATPTKSGTRSSGKGPQPGESSLDFMMRD